jgi:hypothetical protein
VQPLPSLAFPVGARSRPGNAEALGLTPHRQALVHRCESTGAGGRGRRMAVTSFAAVALAEVEELARYRDRAHGTASAQTDPRSLATPPAAP